MGKIVSWGILMAVFCTAGSSSADPGELPAVAPVANTCPRPAAGGPIADPPRLHSANGTLAVSLSFQTRVDEHGRRIFCFMTPDGLQNPMLHVVPGDTLAITVTNNTPRGIGQMGIDPPHCGSPTMSSSAVNIHYHGTNVPPTCGADDVLKTLINSGDTFQYRFTIPIDEPPGLYWYHPHVHGTADLLAMGGATGALIVGGIEKLQPAVAGMPSRIFLVRDQRPLAGDDDDCAVANPAGEVPNRDVSVNFVPNDSSRVGGNVVYAKGRIAVPAGKREFWRVGNLSADTILDLQLLYDGVPQPLEIVAIDGVPVNSQDATEPGRPLSVTRFRLPTASRVEFVVTTPTTRVASAELITNAVDTGPDGDCHPRRALFTIAPSARTAAAPYREARLVRGSGRRFAGLATAPVTARRAIFFAEGEHTFFMTVEGQPNHAFEPGMPPAIVTHVGAVEEWVVQNRTHESHEFHIHQIHFLVESQDNFGKFAPAPGIDGQFLDTVDLPAWDGKSAYPSVKLRMDFRGDIAGRFVFHCHILSHEDKGMMNVIQVDPAVTH
ncbi:multicopper oxidase family protein [Sphingomonas sp.]|uniref:multicopper oxidase family protein n=1 Tax=Sphingomonas sp. TaxID=28214 RepID=UPI0038A4F34B